MSQQRLRSLQTDLFVANSEWTARHSSPYCPGQIEVVAPAVPLHPAGPGWQARDSGVLVFGRVSPEKRIEICIEIVDKLRAAGFPLRLCIAGPDTEGRYREQVASLCRARSAWIERVSLVTGTDKRRLLGRFRYGLSACAIEAFGIATAEMAAEGMVILAPAEGAQSEILRDPMLIYRSTEDAVARFAHILCHDTEQVRLHQLALASRARFAPERFITEVRAIAKRFASGQRNAAGQQTGAGT